MQNYTPEAGKIKIQSIVDQVFELKSADRLIILQKIIFELVDEDRKILIPLLYKAGISQEKVAKALKKDPGFIAKNYPVNPKENPKGVNING